MMSSETCLPRSRDSVCLALKNKLLKRQFAQLLHHQKPHWHTSPLTRSNKCLFSKRCTFFKLFLHRRWISDVEKEFYFESKAFLFSTCPLCIVIIGLHYTTAISKTQNPRNLVMRSGCSRLVRPFGTVLVLQVAPRNQQWSAHALSI